MTVHHALIETTLGELTVVADDHAVRGVYFPRHWTRPVVESFGDQVHTVEHPILARAAIELAEYLDGRRRAFDVPVATEGDEFSERVWAMLREIPYGETTTYGALARRIGDDWRLAQQVGEAVGHNPVSIIIPCHRVVGANGSLTGYAGGLDRKRRLLELEEPVAVSAERLF